MSTRTYRFVKQALLCLFSVLATLLVCEIVLRLVDYQYRPFTLEQAAETNDWRGYHAFADHNSLYDPHLLWRPDPACAPSTTQGFIGGEELPREKEPGEYRIFVFGDSNSAGWFDESIGQVLAAGWPARLRELLAQRSEQFKVVNAAVKHILGD